MQHRLMWISKVFSISIVIISASSLLSFNDACALQNRTILGTDKSDLDNNLLQFTANDHILGFATTKTYIASLDHALIVEYIGTNVVIPQVDGASSATRSAAKSPSLGKVIYQNLWDGINLTYESTKNGIIESTYQVAPGADVSKIRLKYNVPVAQQSDKSLKFRFENGRMTESAPIAWQEIDGKRIPVTVAFKVSRGEVGFSVGKYDCGRPLIIDPIYSWNTFYVSGNTDYMYGNMGSGIAIDNSGNVYITGSSLVSWDGPMGQTPLNPFDNSGSGNSDIFVLKLSNSGAYQWHTFYGSGSGNTGNAIAVDNSGNIYATGDSYGTWNVPGTCSKPGVSPCPLNPLSGSPGDIFVLKLNSGGAYQWHTFYGVSGDDYSSGIALDGSGNVYVTGSTLTTVGWDGPTGQAPLNPFYGYGEFFVLKLNSSGAYQWHTFYGSGDYDMSSAIAVDGIGNVYVTGGSMYSPWPGTCVTPGISPCPLNPFNFDAFEQIFALKLNSAGAYQWHTFYGSGDGDSDTGSGIAVDGSDNVYVTGQSYGLWDGPTGQTPLNPFRGWGDIFVLKLNSGGAYQWNTFYGSGNTSYSFGDMGNGIAVDGSGNVYVTGASYDSWDGPMGQAPLNPFNIDAFEQIFVLKLNSSGTYQWNTFYGSGVASSFNGDMGNGIAVDGSGNVDITGYSYGAWDGPMGQTPLNPFNDSITPDIFVLQLQLSTCSSTAVQIEGTNITSDLIQSVYNVAFSGQTIMIQALGLTETLLLNLNIDVMLQGGYECGFPSAPPGRSTIKGSLTISDGTVTIENLIIQ